jgi:3'-phosphoadenosine 5'-phosphosulfate sulfotransferase (PAPS reductase)/FAD synthetase
MPVNKPIVGDNAFAHESGIHVHGILNNSSTYEPMSPEMVGHSRRIVLGKHTGANAVKSKLKEHHIDLQCVGIRKAEGGARATIKNCFTEKLGETSEFRPVFWFTKEDKKVYNNFYDIKLSDCYVKYNLKRTGCSGCPFATNWKEEIQVIDKYEQKFSKAVRNIFKDSYAYTLEYEKFRDEMNKKYGSWAEY